MFALLHSLGMFGIDLFKPRCRLELENLFKLAATKSMTSIRYRRRRRFGRVQGLERESFAFEIDVEYSVRYVEAKPWAVATITLLLAVVLPVLSQLRQAQYIAVGIAEPSDFGCSARRRPDAEFILRQAIIAVKGDPFAP
jgi:hypothetical protein